MDSTLEKIKAIKQCDLEEYNKYTMLGSGQHGIVFPEERA
jgi:hypothetical protein